MPFSNDAASPEMSDFFRSVYQHNPGHLQKALLSLKEKGCYQLEAIAIVKMSARSSC